MGKSLHNQLAIRVIVLTLAFCLAVRPTLNAADPAEEAARRPHSLSENLFLHATEITDALHNQPLEERSLGQYRTALDSFNQVVRLNADAHLSAQALARMAEIQREMADATGNGAYYQQSVKTFRRLIADYPHSSFVGDALVSIAQIYEENLQDLEGAAGAYRELIDYFPASVMAREAKAVLARFEAELRNRPTDVTATGNANLSEEALDNLLQVVNVRNFGSADYARVVIDLSSDAAFSEQRVSDTRLRVQLSGVAVSPALYGRKFIIGDGRLLRRIQVFESGAPALASAAARSVAVEIEVSSLANYSAFKLNSPERLVIDLHGTNSRVQSQAVREARALDAETSNHTPPEVVAPQPTAANATLSSRPQPTIATTAPVTANQPKMTTGKAHTDLPEINDPILLFGANDTSKAKDTAKSADSLAASVDAKAASSAIKCIVIDPGHGGHDTGTISPNGMREKELTLDVARRLRAYIKRNYPDIEVVMTRDNDRFVALEERTAIANARRADLFISVHANASPSSAASGVETFFVSPDRAKPASRPTPAQANAPSTPTQPAAADSMPAATPAAQTPAQKPQPLMASISTTGNRVAESRELARYIQSGLVRGIGAQSPRTAMNRGVKHAPFAVLVGAAMPSVLAEISFLSNPRDEALLQTSAFRERIAASLFAGLNAYLKKK